MKRLPTLVWNWLKASPSHGETVTVQPAISTDRLIVWHARMGQAMAKVGGARRGAGRPRGSINRRHVDLVASMMEGRQTPLEYLMDVMADPKANEKRGDWAAEKAAVFLHPRPQPVARPVEIDLPDTSATDGIKAALSTITRAAVGGQIAPAEAQSLSALIEAQRKALETGELLERIEKLEAIQPRRYAAGLQVH